MSTLLVALDGYPLQPPPKKMRPPTEVAPMKKRPILREVVVAARLWLAPKGGRNDKTTKKDKKRRAFVQLCICERAWTTRSRYYKLIGPWESNRSFSK